MKVRQSLRENAYQHLKSNEAARVQIEVCMQFKDRNAAHQE